MPLVFLDVMNDVLKRVGVLQGDATNLTTSTVTSTATGLIATDAFTRADIQRQVDIGIQAWREVTHEAYSLALLANEAASATISLATGTREYALPSNFERVAGPDYHNRVMRGATTGRVLYEYPGGYAQMLADQPRATDYTGSPSYWAISPVNRQLRIDSEPATGDIGTYNMLYEASFNLTSTMATTSLPYTDQTAYALMPVVAEVWNRIFKKESDPALLQKSLVRALGNMTHTQQSNRWGLARG